MTATAPFAVPSPAPVLAFGIGPDGTYTRLGQVAAFVLGTLTTLVFFPLAVAAAVLYTHAETRFADDPARARALVNWSWLCIAAPVVLGSVAAVLVAALMVM
ncbi:hypothetical protein AB0C74_30535 [Spirillospora sp. NPDC048832]